MSDLLSVAGSVVGIVSLGIQLCQGAVSFARSIKGREKDLAEGIKEIQMLNSILVSLNTIALAIDRAKIDSADIRQCLLSTRTILRDFELYLIKLRGPQYSDGWRVPDKALRSIKYPFHESGILSLRQSAQRLLDTLKLALDAASLQSSLSQRDKLETIDTFVKNLDSESQANKGEMATLNDQARLNAEQLRQMESTIKDTMADVLQRLASTQTVVRDVEQNIVTRITMVDDSIASGHLDTQAKLEELTKKIEQLSAASTLTARIFQEAKPQGSQLEDETCNFPAERTRRRPTRYPARGTCTCRSRKPVRTSIEYKYWHFRLAIDQHRFPEHETDCLLYRIDEKATSKTHVVIPLKMAWFSRRIILACVELALGTGKPGISVTLKNRVPQEHDPFYKEILGLELDVLRLSRDRYRDQKHAITQLFATFEQLTLTLYRDRKSSPHNRDERGQSHAMAFFQIILGDINDDIALIPSFFDAGMKFVHMLVDMSHETGEGLNIEIIGPLARRRFHEALKQLMSGLVPILQNSSVFPTELAHPRLVPILHTIEDIQYFIDDMEIPPIGRAILSNSLNDLEMCIRDFPESLDERIGISQHTTLDLCVGWPQGLERILQTASGQAACEDWRIDDFASPLSRAIYLGFFESVDLLTRRGSPTGIRPWNTSFFNFESLRSQRLSVNTFKLFVERVASRRRELLSRAQKHLKIFLDYDESSVGDSDAAFLFNALSQAGISDISHLYVDPAYETIFHYRAFHVSQWPMLYRYGFRDQRRHDLLGRTPIMIKRKLPEFCGLLYWLGGHGFLDQTPKVRQDPRIVASATGWHYVAASLGQAGWVPRPDFEAFSDAEFKDKCVCWCNPSGEGCSPFQLYWRSAALSPWLPNFLRYRKPEDLRDFNLEPGPATSMLRLFTFEALEMTHTCCNLDVHPTWELAIQHRNRESFQQIRLDEEELQNAKLLDELMQELVQELREAVSHLGDFKEFIKGRWRRRMSELFVVDSEVVLNMRKTLSNVQTRNVPQSLKNLFGENFEWLGGGCDESHGSDGSSGSDGGDGSDDVYESDHSKNSDK
jgi:hypothetical protein